MKPTISNKRRIVTDDSTRPAKHSRISVLRADGQKSSPSQADSLRARWSATVSGFYEVVKDTAVHYFGRSNDEASRAPSKQSPTSSGGTSDSTLVEPTLVYDASPPRQASISRDLFSASSNSQIARPLGPLRLSVAPTSTPRLPPKTAPQRQLAGSTSNSPALSRFAFSPSPSIASASQQTRPKPQIALGSYHNFSGMSPSPSPSQRDTPLRRPQRRRKGSMGPPALPLLRNTQPFPTSASVGPSSSRQSSGTPVPNFNRSSSVTSSRGGKTEGRQHILSSQHKAQVAATRESIKSEELTKLYEQHKRKGFSSDIKQFESFLDYDFLIQHAGGTDKPNTRQLTASTSSPDLHSLKLYPSRVRRSSDIESSPEYMRSALEKVRATLNGPLPMAPFSPSLEQRRLRDRAKDEEIERRMRSAKKGPPESLPEADEAEVNSLLRKTGIIAKYEREQVSGLDIQRLLPNQWLNDEIINFYGALILGRAEASNKENNSGQKKFLNAHYFNTFFWSKLEKDGYEKARLAKWTKKFDIFSKDVILIPVNHNNVHWTGAAINFKRKRIESYDSMRHPRNNVYKRLREYLDAEHRNKKKKPFDFTGWTDHTLEDIPMQENGYDCGVFTCQFLQALSRGEETFSFSQKNIPYFRRRMIWEMAHTRLRDDDNA